MIRSFPLCGVKVLHPAHMLFTRPPAVPTRQKSKKNKPKVTGPWLSSSLSDWRDLQLRRQSTPTQPIDTRTIPIDLRATSISLSYSSTRITSSEGKKKPFYRLFVPRIFGIIAVRYSTTSRIYQLRKPSLLSPTSCVYRVRYTKSCWLKKHILVNIIMKATNSPTKDQPNSRKIRLKSGVWATFFPQQFFFPWVGIGFI